MLRAIDNVRLGFAGGSLYYGFVLPPGAVDAARLDALGGALEALETPTGCFACAGEVGVPGPGGNDVVIGWELLFDAPGPGRPARALADELAGCRALVGGLRALLPELPELPGLWLETHGERLDALLLRRSPAGEAVLQRVSWRAPARPVDPAILDEDGELSVITSRDGLRGA